MSNTEEYYVNKIGDMQKELDDAYELVEQANKLIEDQRMELTLLKSVKSHKGLSDKQREKYESEIKELKDTLDMFPLDMLSVKYEEMGVYLNQVIKLREAFFNLKDKKKLRFSEVESFDEQLNKISKQVYDKYTEILVLISAIAKDDTKECEISKDEQINSLIKCVWEANNIIISITNKLTKSNNEIVELRESLSAYNGTSNTYKELMAKIADKDTEIDALKTKIAALEFELNRK
ncbi:MAG: hypothetical protein IJ593_11545 [Lachnospiraceae bacterium]|nr:hypothetical protein [Lachnospiraceae bacterium]